MRGAGALAAYRDLPDRLDRIEAETTATLAEVRAAAAAVQSSAVFVGAAALLLGALVALVLVDQLSRAGSRP